MADPASQPDGADETDTPRDGEAATGTPRWVKVFGIIAVALVLLVGIMLVAGGGPGGHGPGRHVGGDDTPSGDDDGRTPPTDGHRPPDGRGGHRPPAGGHTP